MGIFDIFSTGPAVAASGALNQGINMGLGGTQNSDPKEVGG